MPKKIFDILIAIIAAFACMCFLPSCGNKPIKQSSPQKPITVTVGGKKATFEKGFPYIGANGKTLVPLDFFNRYVGANVNWNKETPKIYIRKDKTSIELEVGEPQAMINGKAIALAAPVVVEDGVAMVPVRVISEALGATVDWDATTQGVSITMDGAKTP